MTLTKEDLQAFGELMVAKLDEKFDERLGPINERLNGIDERLDGMNGQFDGIDKRLDGMDKRYDAMARYSQVAATVEDHGDRIYALEQAVNK